MGTRYTCPSCQNRVKSFVRYINTKTGEQVAPKVGRCNRVSKCGYHYPPKQYFQDNGITTDPFLTMPLIRQRPDQTRPISFIKGEIFKSSLHRYESNNFVKYLNELFGLKNTTGLIKRYFIGTSKHWEGATVFWQVDISGHIRTGKIMLYSPITGKRIKEPFDYITWTHTALKLPEFNLKQCLFGEHLLRDKSKSVAIVESEKTAIISSIYFPHFIWLAVGSLTNLTEEKCKILRGRKVVLFPDLKAYDKWKARAGELSYIGTFITSDLLERRATKEERSKGLDLADYLTKFKIEDFKAI